MYYSDRVERYPMPPPFGYAPPPPHLSGHPIPYAGTSYLGTSIPAGPSHVYDHPPLYASAPVLPRSSSLGATVRPATDTADRLSAGYKARDGWVQPELVVFEGELNGQVSPRRMPSRTMRAPCLHCKKEYTLEDLEIHAPACRKAYQRREVLQDYMQPSFQQPTVMYSADTVAKLKRKGLLESGVFPAAELGPTDNTRSVGTTTFADYVNRAKRRGQQGIPELDIYEPAPLPQSTTPRPIPMNRVGTTQVGMPYVERTVISPRQTMTSTMGTSASPPSRTTMGIQAEPPIITTEGVPANQPRVFDPSFLRQTLPELQALVQFVDAIRGAPSAPELYRAPAPYPTAAAPPPPSERWNDPRDQPPVGAMYTALDDTARAVEQICDPNRLYRKPRSMKRGSAAASASSVTAAAEDEPEEDVYDGVVKVRAGTRRVSAAGSEETAPKSVAFKTSAKSAAAAAADTSSKKKAGGGGARPRGVSPGDDIPIPSRPPVDYEKAAERAELEGNTYQGGKNDEGVFEGDGEDLAPCMHCNRRFALDRIVKHMEVCSERADKKKRKPFESSVTRSASGTNTNDPNSPFYSGGKKGGGIGTMAADEPKVDIGQPDAEGRYQCPQPNCRRKFIREAAIRHFPVCARHQHEAKYKMKFQQATSS